MRHSLPFACCLALAACGPTSQFHDYATPERAARSFVEAGRIGDTASVRQSIVAAERNGDLHVDYKDIGDYSLVLERLIEDESAIVTLQAGAIRSPLACIREDGQWKVSIHASLQCMQELLSEPPTTVPAPR